MSVTSSRVDTTVVQCPTPAFLQTFCREDGSLIWRAASSQHGNEGERWFHMVNGALALTCRPQDLVNDCKVFYLAPTCVQDPLADNAIYTRYTVVLSSTRKALGVIFVDQSTGLLAASIIDLDALIVCEPSTIPCSLTNDSLSVTEEVRASLVKECPVEETFLRWGLFIDCANGGRELVQEVWVNQNTIPETRTLRYFICGTEEEVDANTVDTAQLTKCFDYDTIVLLSKPLVYYKFEEADGSPTALDSSGNNNDGTYVGSVTLEQESAFPTLCNSMLVNDVFQSGVDVPDLGTTNDFSIEMWISPIEIKDNDNLWAIGVSTGILFKSAFGGSLNATVGGGSQPIIIVSGGIPLYPVWSHIVMTYNFTTGEIRGYYNGSFSTSSAESPGFSNFNASTLGYFRDRAGYVGYIDEFAIYPTMLSPTQILSHYNNAAQINCPPSF